MSAETWPEQIEEAIIHAQIQVQSNPESTTYEHVREFLRGEIDVPRVLGSLVVAAAERNGYAYNRPSPKTRAENGTLISAFVSTTEATPRLIVRARDRYPAVLAPRLQLQLDISGDNTGRHDVISTRLFASRRINAPYMHSQLYADERGLSLEQRWKLYGTASQSYTAFLDGVSRVAAALANAFIDQLPDLSELSAQQVQLAHWPEAAAA